jgi:rhomboid family GlyGly-CTERM serine protease
MANPEKINFSLPVVTLCGVGLALMAFGCSGLSEILVYDRRAILGGELWRLCTAPLVHFSPGHLLWNLSVFGAAGWMIEASGYRGFWRVCGWAAGVPGLIFLFAIPDLARYGGLSGPATGAVVYLCLFRIKDVGRSRSVWGAMLFMTAAKIMAEWGADTALFVDARNASFRVLPGAHALGFLSAVLVFLKHGGFEKRAAKRSLWTRGGVQKDMPWPGGQG